jgi:hypothetical protein
MTIAAGFECSDGVVLCADTQVTSNIKQNGPKVWTLTDPKSDFVVAMAGAGDVVLIHALRDKLAAFDRPNILGLNFMTMIGMTGSMTGRTPMETLIEALQERILKPFYEQHVYTYPTWETTVRLEFLLAVRVGNRCVLLDSSYATLSTSDHKACIGSGSDLGRYLQETMFDPTMNVRETRRVAAYMLDQVKTYSPWCGGDSDILTIPTVGDPVFATDVEIRSDEMSVRRRIKRASSQSPRRSTRDQKRLPPSPE